MIKEILQYKQPNIDTEKDKEYCLSFGDRFDLNKLGRNIGNGLEHNVYMYGDRHVIKVPRFSGIYSRTAVQIMLAEKYADIYFQPFHIPIEVIEQVTGYLIFQQFLCDCLPLEPHLLKDIIIVEQFHDLLERNRNMAEQHHVSIDFTGGGWNGAIESYIRSCLYHASPAPFLGNIVYTTSTKRLYILDFDTISIPRNNNRLWQHKSFLKQSIFLMVFFQLKIYGT